MGISPGLNLPSREQFAELLKLGKHKPSKSNPDKSFGGVEVHFDGFSLFKVSYMSNGLSVPASLLWPEAKMLAQRTIPGVVVIHTHNSRWVLGKSEMIGAVGDKSRALALDLVKMGYFVLVPDMLGFEERLIKSVHDTDEQEGSIGFQNAVASLIQNGDCYLRYAIEDTMHAVDFLCNIPEVDSKRIGLMGFSFGGHIASKTAVFDDRVRATVAFGAVANIRTKFEHGSKIDATEVVPGLLNVGDTEQLLRLIAPRGLYIASSKNDSYAPKAKEVYDFLIKTAPEGGWPNLEFNDSYESKHELTEQMRKDAYAWLNAQFSFDGSKH